MSEKKKKKPWFWRTKAFFGSLTSPSVREAKNIKKTVSSEVEILKSRMASFSEGRSAKDAEGFEEDFRKVLKAWGMTESDIPQVMKDLKIRMLILLIPTALAFILLIQRLFIPSCIVIICSLIGLATTLWRYNILAQRKFKPFPCQNIIRLMCRKKG